MNELTGRELRACTLQGIGVAVLCFGPEGAALTIGEGPSLTDNCAGSGQPGALLCTTSASLEAHQLAGLHIEAPLGADFPLMKARTTQGFALGALLFDLAKADDVGHRAIVAAAWLWCNPAVSGRNNSLNWAWNRLAFRA